MHNVVVVLLCCLDAKPKSTLFLVHTRNSKRGSVRRSVGPSVRPSVGRSVRHTRVEIANLAYFKQSNGTRRYVT